MSAMLQLISLALLASHLACAQEVKKTCTPLTPDGPFENISDMHKKMRTSEVVLFGTARRTIKSQLYPNADVFSVEFEVKCIYKRPDMDATIGTTLTISDFGEVPGMCVKTNITKDADSIVYLIQGNDMSYRPTYTADSGAAQYREELLGMCQYNPEVPDGVDPDTVSADICDTEYDYPYPCVAEDEEDPELLIPDVNQPEVDPATKEEEKMEKNTTPKTMEEGDEGKEEVPEPNGNGDTMEEKEKPDNPNDQGEGEVPYTPAKSNEGDDGNGVARTFALSLATLMASLVAAVAL